MFRLIAAAIFIVGIVISFYFRRKAEKSSQDVSIREERPFIMVGLRLAGILMWGSVLAYLLNPGWMVWSEVAVPLWIRWVGVGLGVLSVPLLYWLFSSIGTNITQTVGIRQHHQLVTRGPYRWVRHPLYTVGTMFFFGFALMAANWFTALMALVGFVFLILRLPQEEARLIEEFGDDYQTYIKRTGRFFPRLISRGNKMKFSAVLIFFFGFLHAQNLTSNISYVESGHERQVLDVYSPDGARDLPVVFWVHGGGWQAGDKTDVQIKPRIFNERGFLFVSTNHRLWPSVEMGVLTRDVARALGWVHRNIANYGGDPTRIFVMGHSAGAQLAALICTDHRYLEEEEVPVSVLQGCVPIDGDTYDIPAIIFTAEVRQAVHHLPLPKPGHRMKFGNDPVKHREFSTVTHVEQGKAIPPFLILHVAGHPDVRAQARRLGDVLSAAEIPVTVFGAPETTHIQLNEHLGLPEDPATEALFKFLEPLAER